jgi:hypothetical protein
VHPQPFYPQVQLHLVARVGVEVASHKCRSIVRDNSLYGSSQLDDFI